MTRVVTDKVVILNLRLTRNIKMKKLAIHFLSSDDGVTSIEYALIASLIVAAIISTVPLIGTAVAGMFQTVADGFP